MDALGKWLHENPEHHLQSRNDFKVCVVKDGETTVEPYEPAL